MTTSEGTSVSPTPTVITNSQVSLVIERFSSFGRVAHVRRWLLGQAAVSTVRIESYGAGTARFAVGVSPGTLIAALTVPGTRVLRADGHTVTLQVVGA